MEAKYNEWEEYRAKLRNDMPSVVNALINDAKHANSWIYHKPSKRWYTPEDFAQQYKSVFHEHRNKDNHHEFAIMNPWSGLRTRIEYLKKITAEIADFQQRIESYYKLKR